MDLLSSRSPLAPLPDGCAGHHDLSTLNRDYERVHELEVDDLFDLEPLDTDGTAAP
jgi:hypothetical protein